MNEYPQNIEAEQAVLGTILLDPKLVFKAESELTSDDFSVPLNRFVFMGMLDLTRKQEPIDLTTVYEWLRKNDKIESNNVPEYLAGLEDRVTSTGNLLAHIRIVQDVSTRRKMCVYADKLRESAMRDPTNSNDLIQKGVRSLEALKWKGKMGYELLHDNASEFNDALDRKETGKPVIPGPWEEFNARLGGLRPGYHICIAGMSHSGKTTMALNIISSTAYYLKQRQDPSCAVFFTTEERRNTMICHLVSMDLREEFDTLVWSKTPLDPDLAAKAREHYENHLKLLPIRIVDHPKPSIPMIRDTLLDIQNHQPISLVVIDYQQNIRLPQIPFNVRANNEMLHRENVDMLQEMIHSEIIKDCCWITTVMEDPGRKERADALKERMRMQMGTPKYCQAIFEASDAYAVIERDDFFKGTIDPDVKLPVNLTLKKARGAKLGKIPLWFHMPYAIFYERTEQ